MGLGSARDDRTRAVRAPQSPRRALRPFERAEHGAPLLSTALPATALRCDCKGGEDSDRHPNAMDRNDFVPNLSPLGRPTRPPY